MATLAKIKLIEIVLIRYALVTKNYTVNCLNFNVAPGILIKKHLMTSTRLQKTSAKLRLTLNIGM
jgi:hypothetical protein